MCYVTTDLRYEGERKEGRKKKRDGYQNGTLYTPKYILCTSTYRYLVLLYSLALCLDIDI